MTSGEKIKKLRLEKNLTQEELAKLLGVSAEEISLYESNLETPESDILIKMSELFKCSIDYILKEEEKQIKPNIHSCYGNVNIDLNKLKWRSKKKIFNMPLVDINFASKECAKGFISIGIRSKGIISMGIFTCGILSFGVFSLGLVSLGAFAIGLLALGALALGIISIGAIAVGIFSIGAIAVGLASCGALSVGQFYAYGDFAYSNNLAIFKTEGNAPTTIQDSINNMAKNTIIDDTVPKFFAWFAKIFK